MKREPAFVVFSDDWGVHPSSCQHIFRHIIVESDVLWLNTIGMRQPKLTFDDARKAFKKIARMLSMNKGVRSKAPMMARLSVLQPLMLPFTSLAWVRRFNRWSVARSIRKWQERHADHALVVVSTVPNSCDFVSDIHADRVVYYCVDDFTQWPGLEHDLVRQMEQSLVAQADVLVATSQKLCEQLSRSGKPVHFLSHGVDVEHFAQQTAQHHELVAGLPHPRFGYFGLFDERTDQALLKQVAESMSDCSFVLTGTVAVDVTQLAALPNVHFTGPVSYAELPAIVSGLDVLLLPYLVSDFTSTISPLKLKEYLATGRPVVSTPIQEAVRHSEHLLIAADASTWCEALRAALQLNSGVRRTYYRSLLATESWVHKAQQLRELCALP